MKGRPVIDESEHLAQEASAEGELRKSHGFAEPPTAYNKYDTAHKIAEMLSILPQGLDKVIAEVEMMGTNLSNRLVLKAEDTVFKDVLFSQIYILTEDVKGYLTRYKQIPMAGPISKEAIRALENDHNIMFQTYFEGKVCVPIIRQDFYRNNGRSESHRPVREEKQ